MANPIIFDGENRFAIDSATSTTSFKTIETTLTPDAFTPRGMKVVSTNANDTLTGTGVQKVRITYLDSNFNQFTEDINLNGTIAVNTIATNIKHLESFDAIQVGSGGSAAGTIDLADLTDSTLYARIDAGNNQFFSCVHHVKTGKTAFVMGIDLGILSSGVAEIRLEYEQTFTGGGTINRIFHSDIISNFNRKQVDFLIPLRVEGGNHIRMVAKARSSGQVILGRISFFEL